MSTLSGGPNVVMDGLVLYLDAGNRISYPGTGTVWSDISRGGNNGTLTNGPTFNSGNGGSIVFDGTNDYAILGNILNDVIAGNTPKYTFSVWIKFNALANNINYVLFNKVGDTTFGETQRQLGYVVRNLTASSYNGFQFESVQYNTLDTSVYRLVRTVGTGLTTNVIYNLVGTFDSSINTNDGLDRVNLYINSVVQSKTLSFTGGTLSNTFAAGTARLAIGAQLGTNPANAPQGPFNGSMYNIQFYNRALSAQEILQNYNATKSRFNR
jgi:hypothetical protein